MLDDNLPSFDDTSHSFPDLNMLPTKFHDHQGEEVNTRKSHQIGVGALSQACDRSVVVGHTVDPGEVCGDYGTVIRYVLSHISHKYGIDSRECMPPRSLLTKADEQNSLLFAGLLFFAVDDSIKVCGSWDQGTKARGPPLMLSVALASGFLGVSLECKALLSLIW